MKKHLKHFGFKSLAVLLSLLMIFYVLPSTVYAEWFEGGEEQTLSPEPETVVKEVFELTDRREESVKHFRLEDGSIMAVQYADAVHRADENGAWQDIDNTLSTKGSELATSDARVKFAKKITGNETLFTLHEHNRKITMSLDGAKKKTAGTVTNTTTEFDKDATQLQKLMTLDKLSSKILYADILDGVDLEYVVVSNDIKENIIVKERKESYTYTFTIKLNNLEAELTEVGSVVILDPGSGETVYVIPAPIVYDANNIYANRENAFYTLEQSGNNTFAFSVTVSSEWMNDEERAFPVVVDPTVSVATSSVLDLDLDSSSPNNGFPTYPYMYVSNTWRAYWRTYNLPEIPASAYIVNASISLKWYSGSENYVGVYQVLTDWDNTLNWNKIQAATPEGQLSSTLLDYNYIVADGNGNYGDNERFTWNLTGLAKSWYSGTSNNYGVGFLPAVSESAQNTIIFYSTDNSIVGNRPQFTVTYKDMKGVEPYWSFSSQNAGLAGTGYINRATGALTFTKGLLSTTDSLFPYTPTLVYSTSLVEKLQNATQLCLWSYPYAQTAFLDSYMPLGFKWNMQETLIKKAYYKPDGSSSEFFIWSDADGTEHYFLPVGNSATEYEDEDGLQLKLIYDEDEEQYFLTDDSKTVKWFTEISTNPGNDVLESWYLTSIVDKNGNEISFTYNNLLQLTEVCLTPNGSTKITFLKILYSSNLPYLIWNEVSKDAVVFRYLTPDIDNLSPSTAMFLQRLDYAHGNANATATDWLNYYNNGTTTNITVDGTVSYTYDSYGYLIEAKDNVSDYRISYTYTNGKVTSVKEYGQTPETGQNPTPELGQELRLSYYNGYTEVRTSGSDDVIGNADDLITRYTFDKEGRAIGAYTTDPAGTQIYGGAAGTYETDGKIKNNVKESVTVGGSATNYLLNGGFDLIHSSHAADQWTGSSNRVKYEDPYNGNGESYCACFTIQANTTDSISQYTQLPMGNYTVSMDVSTSDCKNVKAYLIVYSISEEWNIIKKEIPINEDYASGGWSLFSASFYAQNYNSNDTEDIRITVQVEGGSNVPSSAYLLVDNIMLEENIGSSNFSLVQYGNFDSFSIDSVGNTVNNMGNYWQTDGGALTRQFAAAPFGYAARLNASISAEKYLKQTVYRASPDDISCYDWGDPYNDSAREFTVSGFAKGTGQVPNANSAFRLRVDVKYYMGSGNNDVTESFCFDFQNDCTDWQFLCGTVTTADHQLIHSVDIYCEFNRQPEGYALFDNIAIYQSNDNGRVRYRYYTDDTAALDDSLSASSYNPTLAGLVHVKESRFYTETYEYNNQRQITRKANDRGELYEYVYANNGIDLEMEIYYQFTILSGAATFYPWFSQDPDSGITKTPKTVTYYSYNSYGQLTQVQTCEAEEENGHIIAADAPCFQTRYVYNTDAGSRIFGTLAREYTSDGRGLEYCYNSANGRLLACVNIFAEAEGTCYTYDAIGRLTSVRPALYDGISYEPIANTEEVSYTYNNLQQLTGINTETTSYTFTYNLFGNAETVGVGNTTLAEYRYHARNGKPEMVIYGNGYAEKYSYDQLDNIKKIWYTENEDGANTEWTPAYEYTYTAYGQLHRFDDLIAGKSTVYTYNTSGKLTGFVEFDAEDQVNEFSSNIRYNDQGNLESLYYSFDYPYGSSLSQRAGNSYYHIYHSDGRLKRLSVSATLTAGGINYTYDSFNRLSSKTSDFYVIEYTGTRFTNTVGYTYETAANNGLTYPRVASYTSQVNNNAATVYRYSYDDSGNITQISDGNNVIQYRYQYDNLGQLIREDNRPMNQSYTYTYDNAGNRTSKKTYDFTTGILHGVLSTQNYGYISGSWGDRLRGGSGGYPIEYDEIGNPTFMGWRDSEDIWSGAVLRWDNRRLVSITYAAQTNEYYDEYSKYTYTYNDQGIRTGKTIDGVTHWYYLDGSKIIMEVVGYDGGEDYRLIYLYDESGAPIGMQYRTPSMAQGVFYTYWFEKNLQGDIVAVYNEEATKLVSYTYDAWGNFSTTISNYNGTNWIASYNPFRYRGYYYDTETGYYYLNSRYYNPQWGRFLNADGYVSTGSGLLGYNMFAYCNNNPVMYVDPDGEFPFLILAFVVVAAVVAVTMTSCTTSSTSNNINSSFDNTTGSDYSWADDDPILSKGRYKNKDDAIDAALDKTYEYAKNYGKEAGGYVYELYGGYYVSSFQSGILATDQCVKLNPSSLPKNANIVASFHSHLWHNESILYQASELRAVRESGIPSYVVDNLGWAYVLTPTARNYMDYTIIRIGAQ